MPVALDVIILSYAEKTSSNLNTESTNGFTFPAEIVSLEFLPSSQSDYTCLHSDNSAASCYPPLCSLHRPSFPSENRQLLALHGQQRKTYWNLALIPVKKVGRLMAPTNLKPWGISPRENPLFHGCGPVEIYAPLGARYFAL